MASRGIQRDFDCNALVVRDQPRGSLRAQNHSSIREFIARFVDAAYLGVVHLVQGPKYTNQKTLDSSDPTAGSSRKHRVYSRSTKCAETNQKKRVHMRSFLQTPFAHPFHGRALLTRRPYRCCRSFRDNSEISCCAPLKP